MQRSDNRTRSLQFLALAAMTLVSSACNLSCSGDENGNASPALRITGRVHDGEVGIEGVELSAEPLDNVAPVQTDDDGNYEILVPLAWSGTITPRHPNYSFDLPRRAYVGVGTDYSGEDFLALPQDGSGRADSAFAVPRGGSCEDDSDCDDGVFCNGPEACASGICAGGPVACTSGEWCDESLNLCVPLYSTTDLSESFESYTAGSDPDGWLDTGPGNSLNPADDFKVFQLDGQRVLGTSSTHVNIHSHMIGGASSGWSRYLFTGRMMATSSESGFGVTFLSNYAASDAYLRLRSYDGIAFHLAPHPHGQVNLGGDVSSGVIPTAGKWYRFAVEVRSTSVRTIIRAKVWQDGQPEPGEWQIDAWDAYPTRRKQGTIGVWSMGDGSKYWDDFEVVTLGCEGDVDGDLVPDCADGCPHDPGKTEPGQCGCGVADSDGDSDGVPDCIDRCAGSDDADGDGDGTPDCEDDCPQNPMKTAPGVCGCDVPDTDSDGDGTPDCQELPVACSNPRVLDFNCATESATFEVWNCGGSTLAFTITDDAEWLSVTPPAGESASAERLTFTATVNRANLSNGSHSAVIRIGPMSPVLIPVHVEVGCSTDHMTAAHRIRGVAPFGVVFDTVDTGGWHSGVIQPPDGDYSAYHYAWNFGDPGSGTWSAGRQDVDNGFPSKNTANGFVAAHVFEEPGAACSSNQDCPGSTCDNSAGVCTHRVTLTVTTPQGLYDYVQDITVLPFTGATYYVSADGNDSWNGLAPSNEGNNRGPFRTVAMGISKARPNTRILLRRGDRWAHSSAMTINFDGPGIIGAYGVGSSPWIEVAGGSAGFDVRGVDWRLQDIKITGPGGNDSGTGLQGDTGGGMSHALFLRMEVSGFNVGIGWSRWEDHFHNDNMIVDCYVHDIHTNGTYIGSRGLAVLGSVIENIDSSHVLRVWQAYKGVISHNHLRNPGDTRHALKLHSPYIGTGWDSTQYVVFSHNHVLGKTWPIAIGPQNVTSDERVSHVLMEGNLCLSEGSVRHGVSIRARNVTVRNNIFDATGASGEYTAANITRWGIEPNPQRIRFENNTVYRADTSSTLRAVELGSSVQDVLVRNNLIVAPQTNSLQLTSGSAIGLVTDHNLVDVDAGFINPAQRNFRLRAHSPAIDAGYDTGIPFDVEGHGRMDDPQTPNSGAGALPYYDVGAFEYDPG